jgi:hypothetical protein
VILPPLFLVVFALVILLGAAVASKKRSAK